MTPKIIIKPNLVFSIILAISLFFLAKVEGGFPVKKFAFNYSCLVVSFLTCYCITKRKTFSLLTASFLLFATISISFRKLDLIGSRLTVDDLSFAITNPAFIFQFVETVEFTIVISILILLLLIYKIESAGSRLHYKSIMTIIIISLFYIYQAPSKASQIYKNGLAENIRNGTLLYLALSFREDFKLSAPLTTDDNNKFCCAKADPKDLKIVSPANKPNIIIILMESTFDVSILNKNIKSSLIKLPYSPIKTYVVGGSTWVQEYAILHGVPPPEYGDYYRAINTLGVGNLDGRIAPSLKTIGYLTKTFSTSKKDFYGAEKFHRSLGIDQYYSMENIPDDGNRSIGYRDDNLFNYLLDNLRVETNPSFVFVTTEINHAPHNIKVGASQYECHAVSPKKCALLYDYHDREEAFATTLNKFLKSLSRIPRNSVVILFGDHIPSDINYEFSDSEFFNKKLETISLFYQTKSEKFVHLDDVLGCKYNKLEISDLDAIALKLAGLSSAYTSAKLHRKILNNCR